MTLVSYLPNTATAKKNVLLMPSIHSQPTVVENGKPEIIQFYNETKGGTDTFDQMCAHFSCSRKTNRWPMCMFFGIVNAAVVNSFLIYRENTSKAQPGIRIQRKKFMRDLALSMIRPACEERISVSTLARHIKLSIRQVCPMNLPSSETAEGPSAAEMKEPPRRCQLCEAKADRNTRFRCHSCKAVVCQHHYYPLCPDCV